jgi:hypothetical protein
MPREVTTAGRRKSPARGARKFDEIFGVLKDDDQPKMKAILDWAKAEGREKEISPELLEIAGSAQLADEQVNQKLAEMEAARKARNFKTSDALRAELTARWHHRRKHKRRACAGEESKKPEAAKDFSPRRKPGVI